MLSYLWKPSCLYGAVRALREDTRVSSYELSGSHKKGVGIPQLCFPLVTFDRSNTYKRNKEQSGTPPKAFRISICTTLGLIFQIQLCPRKDHPLYWHPEQKTAPPEITHGICLQPIPPLFSIITVSKCTLGICESILPLDNEFYVELRTYLVYLYINSRVPGHILQCISLGKQRYFTNCYRLGSMEKLLKETKRPISNV